jgi:hypothetical protein
VIILRNRKREKNRPVVIQNSVSRRILLNMLMLQNAKFQIGICATTQFTSNRKTFSKQAYTDRQEIRPQRRCVVCQNGGKGDAVWGTFLFDSHTKFGLSGNMIYSRLSIIRGNGGENWRG